jgi:DNA-binding NarL/FixJ family response regulator
MIPIRILLVDDAQSDLRSLSEELEEAGGFEVITAASPVSGMLSLARHQPDVLLVNPVAGQGSVEEWRRAVEHYRSARPLGLLVLAGRISARDRETLEELADVGIMEYPLQPELIREVLAHWAGTEEFLSWAA